MKPAAFEGAARWVPARGGLRALSTAVDDCRGCDLWADATQGVPGRGPARAGLMLVGEQPGDVEDLEGAAFVGPAGRLLDQALEEAGIAGDAVYLTNAVKHFRHRGSRGKRRLHQSPTRGQVVACEPWLDAELERIRPLGVILLGAVAAGSVFGSSFRITQHRGKFLVWPGTRPLGHPPAWAMPTIHPAAVLRSPDRRELLASLVEDLAAAQHAVSGAGSRSIEPVSWSPGSG